MFGRHRALAGVTLEVSAGEFLAVLGPNGAGKTTLLRVLATLERPHKGAAWIHGRSVTSDLQDCRSAVGLVSHRPLLYEQLTAAENLKFFATLHGRPVSSSIILEALAQVGLEAVAHVRLGALSHGTVQRLAIARALLHTPAVLLADEPHNGLDPDAADALDDALDRMIASGRTVILATHDVERARRRADKVAVLDGGRVAWFGAAADFPGWRIARSGAAPGSAALPSSLRTPSGTALSEPDAVAAAPPEGRRPSFVHVTRAVMAKDLRTELRAREAVPLALVFGLLLAVLFRFAIPPTFGGLAPAVVGPLLFPGALWISLVFGTTLGLGRAADAETHWGAATACVLSPADRGALFLGKWLGGLVLGGGIAVVLATAAVVFLNVPVVPVAAVALVTTAGLVGWVAAATLVAAMVAGARSREALAPLILLPLATPLLIAAIGATAAVMAGAGLREIGAMIGLLAAYDLIFVVVGFLAYGYVLEVSA